ncbi:MAG: anhydro-N-acetylmuramic acid kinase [Alphaproteobacteria bacterium]|jgi:anhydro-N-acetylmuramic acid kinase
MARMPGQSNEQSNLAQNVPRLALGLMSGTSMDGVDAALLWTDGEQVAEPRGFAFRPYPASFRQAMAAALLDPDRLAPALEAELTDHHVAAVRDLLTTAGVQAEAVSLVGFHGHTVLHQPAQRRTWQLGDAARLAKALGRPVVADFRSADVAAGGEGAPLAPIYHQALAGRAAKPCAFLNLGGVANVTWIGGKAGELVAFDTGPANMLLDEWALRHTGQPVDLGGALACAGTVNEPVLANLLQAPYFARKPPKSLDRLDFDLVAVAGLSPADGAATLVAFTAASVAAACDHFPTTPLTWHVGGGGRHNPVLMQALRMRLGGSVEPVEAKGIDGDGLEAEAFAYLAMRSVRGLPISFPGTTNAPRPLTGGVLSLP